MNPITLVVGFFSVALGLFGMSLLIPGILACVIHGWSDFAQRCFLGSVASLAVATVACVVAGGIEAFVEWCGHSMENRQ